MEYSFSGKTFNVLKAIMLEPETVKDPTDSSLTKMFALFCRERGKFKSAMRMEMLCDRLRDMLDAWQKEHEEKLKQQPIVIPPAVERQIGSNIELRASVLIQLKELSLKTFPLPEKITIKMSEHTVAALREVVKHYEDVGLANPQWGYWDLYRTINVDGVNDSVDDLEEGEL